MFRRHRFGGMLVPLVAGGLLFAFAKHAHRHAHMMHCAEGQAGEDGFSGKARRNSHWPGDFGPAWQHFKRAHHWCFESPAEETAEQAPADANGDQAAS